ncbi:hypothetical protein [Dysgonomonas reticulitermitis]
MTRKVAVLYWRVMVKGLDYAEKGIVKYEEQLLASKIKTLNRLASELNIEISNNKQVVKICHW